MNDVLIKRLIELKLEMIRTGLEFLPPELTKKTEDMGIKVLKKIHEVSTELLKQCEERKSKNQEGLENITIS